MPDETNKRPSGAARRRENWRRIIEMNARRKEHERLIRAGLMEPPPAQPRVPRGRPRPPLQSEDGERDDS